MPTQPNILLILNDDMGYSDIGCYGGEIATPNLDALAAGGLRFTQFYNTARCCPSRASLLTGLHPHQAGVGHMMGDDGIDGYQGDLSPNARHHRRGAASTGGYATYMSGKWHVTRHLGDERLRSTTGPASAASTTTTASSPARPTTSSRARCAATTSASSRKGDDYYLHRRHHATRPCARSASTPRSSRTRPSSSTWPTPRRTGRCTRTPEDIERYQGRFDAGWDTLREERLAAHGRDGHPRRELAAERTGRARAAVGGRGAQGVAGAAHGGLRRADRPHGPGHRPHPRRPCARPASGRTR